MHRKERQIYEKANGAPCLQDRSRGKEILGDARLHRLHRLEQGRARSPSKPEAFNHGDLNSFAARLAGADQDRRQQARCAISVPDQDVAGGEGGVVASGHATKPRCRNSENKIVNYANFARCSSQKSTSRMIRSGAGTGLTGISSPMAPVRYWPMPFSNATRNWASTPDGSNLLTASPATTSSSPMAPTLSTITVSRRNRGCSHSASNVAGDFFPAGMQRWWICRPTFWFRSNAPGKSKDSG